MRIHSVIIVDQIEPNHGSYPNPLVLEPGSEVRALWAVLVLLVARKKNGMAENPPWRPWRPPNGSQARGRGSPDSTSTRGVPPRDGARSEAVL
jgi:hypothetical protein